MREGESRRTREGCTATRPCGRGPNGGYSLQGKEGESRDDKGGLCVTKPLQRRSSKWGIAREGERVVRVNGRWNYRRDGAAGPLLTTSLPSRSTTALNPVPSRNHVEPWNLLLSGISLVILVRSSRAGASIRYFTV